MRHTTNRPWAKSVIRVGTDTVTIRAAATDANATNGGNVHHPAAQQAAKAAVVLALAPDFDVETNDIEIYADEDGGPDVRLTGAVEAHADSVGVVDWSLNLTVDGDSASAVFVAVTNEPLPTIPRR